MVANTTPRIQKRGAARENYEPTRETATREVTEQRQRDYTLVGQLQSTLLSGPASHLSPYSSSA